MQVQANHTDTQAEIAMATSKSAMDSWPVLDLGGLPITRATRDEVASGFIQHALLVRDQLQTPFYSTSANGQVIALCADDAEFLSDFLEADQILADGMPMVFCSRWKHKEPLQERVATTDLYHDVATKAQEAGVSYFLLGGDETSNKRAVANTLTQYPGLKVAGRRNGYFGPDEEAEIVRRINELKPDILWIGMGVPREQKFISRNLQNLKNVGVIKTSGGLFDFLSNKRSRAPGWMQNVGLEWLYRGFLEPRRLGLRYLQTNHKALYRILRS